MKRLICLALIMFACISGCGAQPKPSIGWPQSPRSQKEIENDLKILVGEMIHLHSLFGDRETVLAQQAGPVPEFCLNHTRIEQRWGPTRARMIVVRQGGGRFAFLGRLPYHFSSYCWRCRPGLIRIDIE